MLPEYLLLLGYDRLDVFDESQECLLLVGDLAVLARAVHVQPPLTLHALGGEAVSPPALGIAGDPLPALGDDHHPTEKGGDDWHPGSAAESLDKGGQGTGKEHCQAE